MSTGLSTRSSQSSVDDDVSIGHGMRTLDRAFCSVLSHRICFPLLYFMHNAEEQNDIHPLLPLNIRHNQRDLITTFTNAFDTILVNAWNLSIEERNKELQRMLPSTTAPRNKRSKENLMVLESKLTSKIVCLVNDMQKQVQNTLPFVATSQKEIKFDEVNGKIDIVLENTSNNSETCNDSTKIPYMVFEFGMKHDEWWSKFNQGVKYVEIIYKQSLQKDTPILMVIVTIDPKADTSNHNNSTDNTENNDKTVTTKMGLFFCRPRWTGGEFKGLRISLIWNSNSDTLSVASEQLGKVFEVATLFKSCLEDVDTKDLSSDYEYFSSNCCRIGNKVYRIYDNRYRQTHRSYKAYMNTELQDIVGPSQVVLKISKNPALPSMDGEKELVIISTPYRVGTHTTTQPTAFLPIIEQLVKLHAKNNVHGDIRAFNIVFGEDGKNGWLIDFDFAGPCGETKYPPYYKSMLHDGTRIGYQNETITKIHDWYSLFNVIYGVHELDDEHIEAFESSFRILHRFISGMLSNDDIPSTKVEELKELLTNYENAKGCLRPSRQFMKILDKCPHDKLITRGEGTGSPNNKD